MNMRPTVWAVVLALVTTASAAGQSPAEGEIAGRITDAADAALPGVRIAISGGDERRDVVTDNDGRFVARMLRLGTYRVAVELAGFVPKSGTVTLSPATRRAYVAWPLEVGCIEEDIYVVLGPREAAPMANAIVHVRVKSDDGPLLWSERPECPGTVMQSYTVEVVKAVVRRSGDGGRTPLQILLPPVAVRLKPGEEYVALLWPGGLAGDGLIWPAVAGRIASPRADTLNGMRVEEALAALGQWSRARPR